MSRAGTAALSSPHGQDRALAGRIFAASRWSLPSAVEPASRSLFHGRRWERRDGRGRRLRHLHAEVESATTAGIPVAGQRDEGFLVTEQQTAQIGHNRPPLRLLTLGGNWGSRNPPTSAGSHVFRESPGKLSQRHPPPAAVMTTPDHGGTDVGRRTSALRGSSATTPAKSSSGAGKIPFVSVTVSDSRRFCRLGADHAARGRTRCT